GSGWRTWSGIIASLLFPKLIFAGQQFAPFGFEFITISFFFDEDGFALVGDCFFIIPPGYLCLIVSPPQTGGLVFFERLLQERFLVYVFLGYGLILFLKRVALVVLELYQHFRGDLFI